ncbi:MAG TPA: ribonuclease HII [Lachnospiraceae bacterium]|nr:ribonuclease HII [Lachnospiraceae bacterium]
MKETISQIQERYRRLDRSDLKALEAFAEALSQDERAAARAVGKKAKSAAEKLVLERQRLERMRYYEHLCEQEGYTWICGIDEAGRGPLAGPVVAGAVILPRDCEILGLDDSKKLSEKRREALYEEIMEKAVAAGCGVIGNRRIDEINILQADYEAMCEAIGKLRVMPQVLLNDAVTIPQVKLPQKNIVHGDAKSVSIAAASIIAKVTRDRMMVEYDALFPEYGFARHKGYGTSDHYAALRKYGPCAIHRMTFLKNLSDKEL